MLGESPASSSRAVTVSELRSNNLESTAWVAVRGKVYDLTTFLDRHPGGKDILLAAAGKDVTPLFETSHGPKERRTLEKFLVGSLVGKDLPGNPPPDEFSVVLKARVAAHFKLNSIDPKHSPFSVLRYLVTLLVLVSLYSIQWSSVGLSSPVVFYLSAFCFGLVQMQWAATAVHDGSHGAVGRSPFWWTILAASHDWVNGASSALWSYQHVLSHHQYTNIEGADVDIETKEIDFRRIKSSQKWIWIYKFQPLYAPVLYILLGMTVRIADIDDAFISKSRGALKVNPFTAKQQFIFWGGKIFFFVHRLVIPLAFSRASTTAVIASFLLSDFVFSFASAIIFQASHVTSDVAWPLPNPDTGDMNEDWCRSQVETGQDYGHGDPWITFFAGALNYQVVHHLFPSIAQPYYAAVAPIVVATALEYNVPYVIKDTLVEAIGGHFALLQLLATPPHAH